MMIWEAELELLLWNNIEKRELYQNACQAAQGDEIAYINLLRSIMRFATSRSVEKNVFREAMLLLLCEDENPWTQASLRKTRTQQLDQWALRDLTLFLNVLRQCEERASQWELPVVQETLGMGRKEWASTAYKRSLAKIVEAEDAPSLLQALDAHIATFALGQDSDCAAFVWDGKNLSGIRSLDERTFAELQHIEFQRDVLLENTKAFLAGYEANNVLLCGSMGGGKSSSIKALLTEFREQGLRMVEVSRAAYGSIPLLLETLTRRGGYYILVLDDLSFEESDPAYTQLKVALDGHLDRQNEKILFYATSNRRNLVRDTWSDRAGGDDEVNATDTMSEKHSLVERFGIKLFFGRYSQDEYLDMIAMALAREGFSYDDTVKAEAILWERSYHTRSGRTAANFVKHYIAASEEKQSQSFSKNEKTRKGAI